jgi:hypothetical protein
MQESGTIRQTFLHAKTYDHDQNLLCRIYQRIFPCFHRSYCTLYSSLYLPWISQNLSVSLAEVPVVSPNLFIRISLEFISISHKTPCLSHRLHIPALLVSPMALPLSPLDLPSQIFQYPCISPGSISIFLDRSMSSRFICISHESRRTSSEFPIPNLSLLWVLLFYLPCIFYHPGFFCISSQSLSSGSPCMYHDFLLSHMNLFVSQMLDLPVSPCVSFQFHNISHGSHIPDLAASPSDLFVSPCRCPDLLLSSTDLFVSPINHNIFS